MHRGKYLGCLIALGLCVGAVFAAESHKAQWEEGMDDDAGEAKKTTLTDLPAADFEGARKIYSKRDRLYTTSLNGTWSFKLLPGLETPDELKGWNEPGYDVSGWDDIAVPGNWETQGFKAPQYGNQIDEMAGYYVRNFRWNYRWEGQRVILRFDGVLFGYEVWVNGEYVGRWGSAYNLAQWDITDKLTKGRNTIAVKVLTRSHGWLFDTNDCWCIAGIQRNVELFTVPNDYIEDIVFRTNDISYENDKASAEVSVKVDMGVFEDNLAKTEKVYISLVDEDGVHALDFERKLNKDSRSVEVSGKIENAHLWSAENPYLYSLVVTLADKEGRKIERIQEMQGVRLVKLVDKHLEINGKVTFLNGVAWNEIDPVEGRAISEKERRHQMQLMKKAGVNAIRTAHYPFGPDFLQLADEMGFYVIDEIPFGSRGSGYLKNRAYKDELICRTEATMRRDKNFASVIFWTFGNENTFTPNTKDVLAYAKEKDPTRPRGLPQIGSSQAKETMYHPERDVDFVSPHYLSRENMREYEQNTTKALVQTEFAHACGNGFCDFEDRFSRMKAKPDLWMGGFVWAWIDQSLMHPDNGEDMTNALKLTRIIKPNGDLPKDMRRDLPFEFQGNYVDALHFIDSWGDRATDGIVYGDGTPKDGYWLVRALYGGKVATPRAPIAPPKIAFPPSASDMMSIQGNEIYLRIGRKLGLDQQIQTLAKKKDFRHDEYMVAPDIISRIAKPGEVKLRMRWRIDGKDDIFIEGDVVITLEEDGKLKVAYDLAPNEKCAKLHFTELGLSLYGSGDRVDWVGDGALSSVPGKSKMNVFGYWTMHGDDYRFPGNRSNVKWAAIGRNGRPEVSIIESGTGNVSFEKIDRQIYLTENLTVAGYGGKSSGPGSLVEASELKMKGEFKVYEAKFENDRGDVAPDLTYTYHYGF